MPPKRMKYEARFKMKVVEFAQNMNNSAAARRFSDNEKLVRDWRKNNDKTNEPSAPIVRVNVTGLNSKKV